MTADDLQIANPGLYAELRASGLTHAGIDRWLLKRYARQAIPRWLARALGIRQD